MKIQFLALMTTVAALAACTSNMQTSAPSHGHAHPHPHMHGQQPAPQSSLQSGSVRTFECENGMTATVRYNIDDRIDANNFVQLSVDTIGASVKLQQAVAGSGVRYMANSGFYNKPTDWHEKGNQAYFEFNDNYGNNVNTSCRVK